MKTTYTLVYRNKLTGSAHRDSSSYVTDAQDPGGVNIKHTANELNASMGKDEAAEHEWVVWTASEK